MSRGREMSERVTKLTGDVSVTCVGETREMQTRTRTRQSESKRERERRAARAREA